jgi:hypothetical protein
MINNIWTYIILQIDKIWAYIIAQIHMINPLVWILLFVVSIIYDVVYTKSILYISRLDAVPAANLSATLYFMIAICTINYVGQPFNTIPLIFGAWVGTYGILKYEKYKRDKRRREKAQSNQKNVL